MLAAVGPAGYVLALDNSPSCGHYGRSIGRGTVNSLFFAFNSL